MQSIRREGEWKCLAVQITAPPRRSKAAVAAPRVIEEKGAPSNKEMKLKPGQLWSFAAYPPCWADNEVSHGGYADGRS
jgi:hypothetical protein